MTHNIREVEEFSKKWHELGIPNGCLVQMREYHNQQLQKARKEERELFKQKDYADARIDHRLIALEYLYDIKKQYHLNGYIDGVIEALTPTQTELNQDK